MASSPAQASQLGVDDLAVAEVDVAVLPAPLRQVDDAALARDLEGLQQVDDGHVLASSPRSACGPDVVRAVGRDVLLRAARQEQVHARDELAHEDGLGEVVLDAELEAPDLVLDRLLAGQEDDGDGRPLGPLLQLAHEGVAVELGQARVAEDQVGRERLDLGERVEAVGGRGDAVARPS